MVIVKFKNGKYGIRRTSWFRYEFLGRSWRSWLWRDSTTADFIEYDSLEAVLTRRNKEINWQNQTARDNGSIVPIPEIMGSTEFTH